jgi:hypothetical protein
LYLCGKSLDFARRKFNNLYEIFIGLKDLKKEGKESEAIYV